MVVQFYDRAGTAGELDGRHKVAVVGKENGSLDLMAIAEVDQVNGKEDIDHFLFVSDRTVWRCSLCEPAEFDLKAGFSLERKGELVKLAFSTTFLRRRSWAGIRGAVVVVGTQAFLSVGDGIRELQDRKYERR